MLHDFIKTSFSKPHLSSVELPSSKEMEPGDHLYSPREFYTHHGIYIGDNKVIHYSGFCNGMNRGTICEASLSTFANGNEVKVLPRTFRRYNHQETIKRARSRLGEDMYDVLLNNCEHFVNWCISGVHESKQVDTLKNIHETIQPQVKCMLQGKGYSTPYPEFPFPPRGPIPSPIDQLSTITTALTAAIIAKEILDETPLKDTAVEIVDTATDILGETVEGVGNLIDKGVTGALDALDELVSFFD